MKLKTQNQEIANKVKLLAQIKARGEWKDSFRDILMSEISEQKQTEQRNVNAFDYFSAFSQSLKVQVFQPAVAILAVLSVFLGSSLLANSAFYSLPGDNLYDLKIAMEKAQISLIIDDEKKTELRIEFATNRMDEFEKIASLPPDEHYERTVLEITERFKSDVLFINEHINSLEQQQKPVFSLAKAIDSKTSELAQSLAKNKERLPDDIKEQLASVLDDAVSTAENTSDSAFRIAVNSYKEGGSEEEEQAVVDLVNSKINDLEERISEIEDGEMLIEAQDLLVLAKESLENSDYEATVQNISQSQDLVNIIENQVAAEENTQNLNENTPEEDLDGENQEEAEQEGLDASLDQVTIQATSTLSSQSESLLETTEEIIE